MVRKLKSARLSPQSWLQMEGPGSNKGHLRPVQADKGDAALMAQWRTACFRDFFTWIKPVEKELRQWLEGYNDLANDIIFMIELPPGIPIGQVSLYAIDADRRIAEFGRMIKSAQNAPKGAMSIAAEAVIDWGFGDLDLREIKLEAFSENNRAISLYRNLGFQISCVNQFVMTRNSQGIVKWAKIEAGQKAPSQHRYREVYEMVLRRSKWVKR